MFKNLSVLRFAVLLGAMLFFSLSVTMQAEARMSKAICKTVKGPVYISRSLTKSRFLAYSKCARYRKGSWKFLRRKVRCVKRYKRGKRIYRCRCIARLCKMRTAAKARKAAVMSPPEKKDMKAPVKKMAPKPAPMKKAEPAKKAEKKAEQPPVSTKKSDQAEMKKKASPKKEEAKPEMKKMSEKSDVASEKKPAEKKPAGDQAKEKMTK